MGATIGEWLDRLRGKRKVQAEAPRRVEIVSACPQCKVMMRWVMGSLPAAMFVTCAACGYGWVPKVELIG